MSSNAATSLLRSGAKGAIAGGCFVLSLPLTAQDDSPVTPAEDSAPATPEAEDERTIIDLSVTVPKEEPDKLLEKDCEEANDAARIANEIIVCREIGTASDGAFDKQDWERRYAEKTKGASTPSTFGIPNHGNPIGFGSVPPPALIIDVSALPEAPPGSDADRIARGLPPLGTRELTEEEERARRESLGEPAVDPLVAPE